MCVLRLYNKLRLTSYVLRLTSYYQIKTPVTNPTNIQRCKHFNKQTYEERKKETNQQTNIQIVLPNKYKIFHTVGFIVDDA